MEVIPALSGWLSSRQKVLLDTLTNAIAEVKASPGEAAVNAIKGMARTGMDLGAGSASVSNPLTAPFSALIRQGGEALKEKILPSNATALESIGEAAGPPMKLGAKVAGVVAPKAAMAVAGAFPLHHNMNKMFESSRGKGVSSRNRHDAGQVRLEQYRSRSEGYQGLEAGNGSCSSLSTIPPAGELA